MFFLIATVTSQIAQEPNYEQSNKLRYIVAVIIVNL